MCNLVFHLHAIVGREEGLPGPKGEPGDADSFWIVFDLN
jgi:hypothetical protein